MRKILNSLILTFVIFLSLLSLSFTSGKRGKPDKTYYSDSIANADYIKRIVTYNKAFPFIRYNQNYIEWDDYSAVEPFFEKIKETPERKLKILHIGDSHVQTDIFTGFIRNEMQKIFGNGGRGFVFPYAAAGTHSAYDYKTSYTGDWKFARNTQALPLYDIGVTGASIYTNDSSASFKFVFPAGSLNEDFNLLKLYCKKSPNSYDIKIKASGVASPLYVDCNAFNDRLFIEIKLPKASDTLEFFVTKNDTAQNFFECYGLLIETSDNKGVLYNSVGINGAGLKSVLRENLLLYQLSELRPDVVIIDLGINDIFKTSFNKTSLENDLSKIIDIIQRASPEVAIIISNPQDVYYRRWNEVNCKSFSELSREIAYRKGCAFYDYYNISGGRYSMLKWFNAGLAKPDRVHLNAPGYYVRGELILNAILNSYSYALKNGSNSPFVAAKEFPDTINVNVKIALKNMPDIKDTNQFVSKPQYQSKTQQTLNYKIKSGDNLGSIALKYGVTVNQLKMWNGIKGTNINIGKVLVIYKQGYVKTAPASGGTTQTQSVSKQQTANAAKTTTNTSSTASATKPNTSTATKTGKITYTVKAGDNLWVIARKNNTTVENIKKANNLKSNDLKPGTVLIIRK